MDFLIVGRLSKVEVQLRSVLGGLHVTISVLNWVLIWLKLLVFLHKAMVLLILIFDVFLKFSRALPKLDQLSVFVIDTLLRF